MLFNRYTGKRYFFSNGSGVPVEFRDFINGTYYRLLIKSRNFQDIIYLYRDMIESFEFELSLNGTGSGELVVNDFFSSFLDQSQFVIFQKCFFRDGIEQQRTNLFTGWIAEATGDKFKIKSIANIADLANFNVFPQGTSGQTAVLGLTGLVSEAIKSLNRALSYDFNISGTQPFIFSQSLIGLTAPAVVSGTDISAFNGKKISEILKDDFLISETATGRKGFFKIGQDFKMSIEWISEFAKAPAFSIYAGIVSEKSVNISESARYQKKGQPTAFNVSLKNSITSILKESIVDDLTDTEKISDYTRDVRFPGVEAPYIKDFINPGDLAQITYDTQENYLDNYFNLTNQNININDADFLNSLYTNKDYKIIIKAPDAKRALASDFIIKIFFENSVFDFSDGVGTLLEKLERFGFKFNRMNREFFELDSIEYAPVEFVLTIPEKKIVGIQYYIKDLQGVEPFFIIQNKQTNRRIANLRAEVVKYKWENGVQSAGTFNKTKDKIF